MNYRQKIISLVESDRLRMKALKTVSRLNLPDCWIAAGFIRNLIWDDLFQLKTRLNDIDVVYYCAEDTTKKSDRLLEQRLLEVEPSLPWSVKNQARMHLKHNHKQYQDTLDGMSFWPEKQTCVGVRLVATLGEKSNVESVIEVSHCFDLSLQFDGTIQQNPKCPITVFENRLVSKYWLRQWPELSVEKANTENSPVCD